jgi:hypothetical protein
MTSTSVSSRSTAGAGRTASIVAASGASSRQHPPRRRPIEDDEVCRRHNRCMQRQVLTKHIQTFPIKLPRPSESADERSATGTEGSTYAPHCVQRASLHCPIRRGRHMAAAARHAFISAYRAQPPVGHRYSRRGPGGSRALGTCRAPRRVGQEHQCIIWRRLPGRSLPTIEPVEILDG